LHQPAKRTNPLQRTKDEDDLHQAGDPWPTDEEKSDQHQRSDNTYCIAITHEMGAKNDKTQDDRDVHQRVHYVRMMADDVGLW
jgi:hypothetical protein